jgi:hypothetical protein
MVARKTSELTGAALDWAVAKCWWHDEFDRKRVWVHNKKTRILNNSDVAHDRRYYYSQEWKPSIDWSQGGPIIERDEICLQKVGLFGEEEEFGPWAASIAENSGYGPTPLIAAMRCEVAFRLGDEVEIPEELIDNTGKEHGDASV